MEIWGSPVAVDRGSRILSRRARRLDLPLPVRPQMATFSPGWMVRVILSRASGISLSILSSSLFGLK